MKKSLSNTFDPFQSDRPWIVVMIFKNKKFSFDLAWPNAVMKVFSKKRVTWFESLESFNQKRTGGFDIDENKL